MDPIMDELLIIKDENGNVFWPLFDLNSIGNMDPGEGYQTKMENTEVFSYPSGELSRYSYIPLSPTIHFDKVHSTGNNMTIGLPLHAWESTPLIGDEVAAYNEDNRLIGSTTFQGEHLALTVWGDDETTKEKDGINETETISFRLWNSFTGLEKFLEIIWKEGVGVYSNNGISIAGQIILGNELTSERQLVKITDVLGREVNGNEKNVMLLYIYDDGSIERVFIKE
jgi:hypothetical protein